MIDRIRADIERPLDFESSFDSIEEFEEFVNDMIEDVSTSQITTARSEHLGFVAHNGEELAEVQLCVEADGWEFINTPREVKEDGGSEEGGS